MYVLARNIGLNFFKKNSIDARTHTILLNLLKQEVELAKVELTSYFVLMYLFFLEEK